MGFVTPYEDIGRVEVGGVDWVEGVGNGVQSRLHTCLPIHCNSSDCARKLAQINKCMDECWKVMLLPFPVDHCAIIPRFTVITWMRTVHVTPFICVRGKAPKRLLWHLGQAEVSKKLRHQRWKFHDWLCVLTTTHMCPTARGEFITSFPHKVEFTSRVELMVAGSSLWFIFPDVGMAQPFVALNICPSK